jgi:hypothetical protein
MLLEIQTFFREETVSLDINNTKKKKKGQEVGTFVPLTTTRAQAKPQERSFIYAVS